jgi:hypothetical protein
MALNLTKRRAWSRIPGTNWAQPRGATALEERNPYVAARQWLAAGRLTIGQAIAWTATDGDFIAECTLQGRDPMERAAAIVTNVWLPEIINPKGA